MAFVIHYIKINKASTWKKNFMFLLCYKNYKAKKNLKHYKLKLVQYIWLKIMLTVLYV